MRPLLVFAGVLLAALTILLVLTLARPTLPPAQAAAPAATPLSFQTAETNVQVRDPSTIVQAKDGTYWVYGTGKGIRQFSSKDLKHWTEQERMFSNAPAWVAATVPANKDNTAWAPDIHFFGGKWNLYYVYSQFGTNHSGIGLATNPTLDPKSWTDQGLVIKTGDGVNFNALDPCIFVDAGGSPWMSFGSYFSGLKLLKIDPQTGMQSQTDKTIYNLATRPSVSGNPIEAAASFYHDGWYYLFVNWDSCCAGAKSAYNIRVGRSKTVTGPYLDKEGKDMMAGGGSLFLNSTNDNGTGRPIDDEIGPGHVGILHTADGDFVSTHYEWARDKGGATTMNVQRLAWDTDGGWPLAVIPPGPYRIVSALATHAVLDNRAGDSVEMQPITGDKSQRWTLAYAGGGDYSLRNAATGKALSVVADSPQPGAKVEAAALTSRSSQLWRLRQNEDGTVTLLPKSGGGKVALDVPGGSLSDGTRLGQWNDNTLDPQKWSLRVY